ncbi:MAG: hypothetical protein AAFY88_04410 [Acidobacteriota bacterium]
MSVPQPETVDLFPYSVQVEDGEAVIGRPETGVFFALPVEALELIEGLAAGESVSTVRDQFAERHGESPDMADFLAHLHAHGLIRPVGAGGEGTAEIPQFRDQFGWIPKPLAQAFFSRPAWLLYLSTVLGAVAIVVAEPGLLPGWRAAYFPRDTALMLVGLMALGLLTTAFHELGHVLAARAKGVATRFGIGNRLWFVVWETDMTGVWALPRRQRFLPILAGPLVDLVSASALVIVLWTAEMGWLAPPDKGLQIGRALLLIYLLRLVWQAYFFVRTDYYYAITNAFNCKNLMADTEAFLGERWARLRGKNPPSSLGHLPAREQRAVRTYSLIWLVGRGAAFGILFFIQLPLLFNYGRLAVGWAGGLSRGGASAAIPATTWLPIVMFLLFFGAGMVMWLRPLIKSWLHAPSSRRRTDPVEPTRHP